MQMLHPNGYKYAENVFHIAWIRIIFVIIVMTKKERLMQKNQIHIGLAQLASSSSENKNYLKFIQFDNENILKIW